MDFNPDNNEVDQQLFENIVDYEILKADDNNAAEDLGLSGLGSEMIRRNLSSNNSLNQTPLEQIDKNGTEAKKADNKTDGSFVHLENLEVESYFSSSESSSDDS